MSQSSKNHSFAFANQTNTHTHTPIESVRSGMRELLLDYFVPIHSDVYVYVIASYANTRKAYLVKYYLHKMHCKYSIYCITRLICVLALSHMTNRPI